MPTTVRPSDDAGAARPVLDIDSAASDARAAVAALVAELQAGWDTHDADITDGSLANDVLWGSPFGATLQGYEPLHAIHIRLKEHAAGGPSSRFEIVNVIAPAPDVVLAQVRRLALDVDGNAIDPTADLTGAFSEMALYVLVRRDGTWWLAAGQNTPVRPAAGLMGGRISDLVRSP
jgi:uncharacterized protein (TIGR02246 family)